MLKTLKFTRYTDLDDSIISKASELGFYLIGGTALEIYTEKYKIKPNRNRSNNDIDFLMTKDNRNYQAFKDFLIANIDPKKVTVDVLKTDKLLPSYLFNKIEGIKIMNPMYSIKSKITRMTNLDLSFKKDFIRFNTDKLDIVDLFKVLDKSKTENQALIYFQSVFTEKEMILFNNLVEELV